MTPPRPTQPLQLAPSNRLMYPPSSAPRATITASDGLGAAMAGGPLMYPPRPIQPAADPVVGAQRASLVAGFGHGEDEPGVQRFVQRVPRQQVAQTQTHVAVAVHRVGGR